MEMSGYLAAVREMSGGSRQRELLYTMTLAAVKMRKMYSDLFKLAGFDNWVM